MQSGGSTPVMNRSLYGVVDEALASRAFGGVYGAAHGVEGLLGGDLIDLTGRSASSWSSIARSPGAALGSTRTKVRDEDLPAIIETLSGHGVSHLITIGGNDSAETAHTIGLQGRARGHDLTVMNVPKTIDNDLVMTDHSPGYGSAATFVALATMGAGRDAEAMGRASPVTVIEVMGRDSGWLAASSALARREERDAPHVICIPETPLNEDLFVDRMEDAYRMFGFAVAVVAENARGPEGALGGQDEPWYVDDFGHPYYDGPARYLAGLISRRLGVRARYEKPGTIQRSMVSCVSATDAREAEMAGRAAVRYALEGHTDEIVTIVRESGEKYACRTGVAPLAQVAGQVRTMPEKYLAEGRSFVTKEFIDYVRPLVGRLPQLGRLR